jgi:glucose-1-phosphate thymidylyltransferase
MFVLEKEGIKDDILLSVADNVFEFEIADFVKYAKEKNAPCLTGSYSDDIEVLRRMGVGKIDENNKLLEVEEKPQEPKGNILLWALYYYPKDVVELFEEYKAAGNSMDSPGRFTEYLYKVKDEYVYLIEDNYDIGDLKVLEDVRKIYSEK